MMSHRRLLHLVVSGLLASIVLFSIPGSGLLPGLGSDSNPSRAAASACPAGTSVQNDLFHDGGPLYLSPQEPDPGEPVTLTLRTGLCDISSVALAYRLKVGDTAHTHPLVLVGHDATGHYALWRGSVRIGQAGSLFTYRFEVTTTDGQQLWYGANGPAPSTYGAGRFAIAPGFHVPQWAETAIYYQIFPDRFKNGNPKNDVRTGEYVYEGQPVQAQPWTALPQNPPHNSDFFGGDLAGISQEVAPYLQKTLGVTALYLNPIFQSPSNHKYDTQDYFKVDPHFGTNADLQNLTRQLHSAGMRLILDGVFNHTGDWNRWFNRAGVYSTLGAYNSQKSPWYTYYTFLSWPDLYATFGGYDTLPALNYHTAAVRDVIYRSPHSVVQTYLRAPYNIDGWRLDAADQVAGDQNTEVWQQVRQAAKTANPQSVLIGEVWSSSQQWLDGTQWDGAMNYNGFGFPVSEWVTGQDMKGQATPAAPSGLGLMLSSAANALPRPAQLAQMNSLSTHDVPRFLYRANGDTRKLALGLVLQMTAVGAPTIYYGDEIGMTGATDPDDRRPFDWNQTHWNRAILTLYQKLIALRRLSSSLQTGSVTTLLTDDTHNVYVTGRWDVHNAVIAALNDDNKPHTVTFDARAIEAPGGSTFTNVLQGGKVTSSSTGNITLTLPAEGAVVLSHSFQP